MLPAYHNVSIYLYSQLVIRSTGTASLCKRHGTHKGNVPETGMAF